MYLFMRVYDEIMFVFIVQQVHCLKLTSQYHTMVTLQLLIASSSHSLCVLCLDGSWAPLSSSDVTWLIVRKQHINQCHHVVTSVGQQDMHVCV